MRAQQATLFDGDRLTLGDSIGLTADSLRAYGERHDHWAIAYSGGKDSTALLTVVIHLVKTGRVPRPRRLTVCYADTRMELPPLSGAAAEVLEQVRRDGFEVRVVLPPMDDRYFVYMLGRGVPPPSNTFRWCTGQIKVEPMAAELERLCVAEGFGRHVDGAYQSYDRDAYEADPEYLDAVRGLREAKQRDVEADVIAAKERLRAVARRIVPEPRKVLMLTGVRQGESAARDQRIAMSCGKAGSECGQGWYQETLPEDLCDTLAPILHWRVCLVWDWLTGLVLPEHRHGYPTRLVAEAYGLNEEGGSAEANARTGCCGCPLATRDTAIENLLRFERWAYLTPLTELRPLYRELKRPVHRIRKPGDERRKDGTLSRNQNRMGPLAFEDRRWALGKILDIQARCNEARPVDMPMVDILNDVEVARIHELIDARTWPNKWTGDEPRADQPYAEWRADGSIQASLFGN